MYYECHITFEVGKDDLNAMNPETWVTEIGWSYSAVSDHIVLGKGKKHYATKHFRHDKPIWEIIDEMGVAASEIARYFVPRRKKIELVLHDVVINRHGGIRTVKRFGGKT